VLCGKVADSSGDWLLPWPMRRLEGEDAPALPFQNDRESSEFARAIRKFEFLANTRFLVLWWHHFFGMSTTMMRERSLRLLILLHATVLVNARSLQGGEVFVDVEQVSAKRKSTVGRANKRLLLILTALL